MIIIGEKINATHPSVKTIIEDRNAAAIIDLAKQQTAAGAQYIDVNVGTGIGSQDDEVNAIKWAVETLQKAVDTPLCIDSADPVVLKAGVQAINGGDLMINSTKAEEKDLEAVVPLAVETDALLVALTMEGVGVPETVGERLTAGKKIASACEKHGMPIEKVYFDPLVMPVSTNTNAGRITLETLAAIKETFPGAKTVTGLSNISYGLPKRPLLNAAFLHMSFYAGLDAAIVDPLDETLMSAVRAGNVLTGKDRYCRRYIRAFRNQKEEVS